MSAETKSAIVGAGADGAPSLTERFLNLIPEIDGLPAAGKREEPEEEGDAPAAPGTESGDETTPEETKEESQEDDEEASGQPEHEEPGTTEPSDEVAVTVRIGDADEKLTLAELKRGYLRTSDYTKKTMSLAEERRAHQSEIEQKRNDYGQRLEQAQVLLEALAPKEPDWDELRASDPAEYAAQRADFDQRRQLLHRVKGERERLNAEAMKERNAALSAAAREEQQRMLQAVPAWKDAKVRAAEINEMFEHGVVGLGFTPEEIDGTIDHRALVALRESMLYRKLMANKPKVQAKAKGVPVVKPGAKAPARRPVTALDAAKAKVKQTGSVRDAAAAFLQMID